jgi:hypothetical protein
MNQENALAITYLGILLFYMYVAFGDKWMHQFGKFWKKHFKHLL